MTCLQKFVVSSLPSPRTHLHIGRDDDVDGQLSEIQNFIQKMKVYFRSGTVNTFLVLLIEKKTTPFTANNFSRKMNETLTLSFSMLMT